MTIIWLKCVCGETNKWRLCKDRGIGNWPGRVPLCCSVLVVDIIHTTIRCQTTFPEVWQVRNCCNNDENFSVKSRWHLKLFFARFDSECEMEVVFIALVVRCPVYFVTIKRMKDITILWRFAHIQRSHNRNHFFVVVWMLDWTNKKKVFIAIKTNKKATLSTWLVSSS